MKTKEAAEPSVLDQIKTAVFTEHEENVVALNRFINTKIPKKFRDELIDLIAKVNGSMLGTWICDRQKPGHFPH